MRSLRKFKWLISKILLLAFFNMFFCVNQDGDDHILGWIDFDAMLPLISLLGPNPYPLNVGDSYIEAGATAFDSIDGDLSSDIIIDNSSINTSSEGDYNVTYTVTDSDGKTTEATRVVSVKNSIGTDNEKPVLVIIGNNPFCLVIGNTYTDPGATATDNVDGNITYKIKKYDTLFNITNPDTHIVYYVVMDAAGNVALATRMVIVSVEDKEAPVITLNGPNPTNVNVGNTYSELGASAVDNVDGDLSSDIVIDNSEVNTNQAGVYKVYYTVSDKAGNMAQEIRNVNVSVMHATGTD